MQLQSLHTLIVGHREWMTPKGMFLRVAKFFLIVFWGGGRKSRP